MNLTPEQATAKLREALVGRVIRDIHIQEPNELGTSGRLVLELAPVSEPVDTALEVCPVEDVMTAADNLDWLFLDLITGIGCCPTHSTIEFREPKKEVYVSDGMSKLIWWRDSLAQDSFGEGLSREIQHKLNKEDGSRVPAYLQESFKQFKAMTPEQQYETVFAVLKE